MTGNGLLTGMWFTLKRFFGKKDTIQYPEQKIPMTERFRGGMLVLNARKCIACGLCAMSCPNAAICLTTEKTQDNKKQLSSYIYQAGYCLYCNLCIEACPTQAIAWNRNYEIAVYHKDLLNADCLAQAKQAEVSAELEPAADAKKEGISLGR